MEHFSGSKAGGDAREGGHGSHNLKLWSIGAEIESKTDTLADVRSRLNTVFQQNAEVGRQNFTAEYWNQVEQKVQEQMLKKEIARTHSEYWDRQNNDQIHQQLKILETAP